MNPLDQAAQTRFRAAIVAAWSIPSGARVLEIGCGQGDMTAVLAETVGPHGRVVAVDPAPPDYGTPVTIGESIRALATGPYADRLESRLGFDPLAPENDFADDAFDFVVLAHCTWYFPSIDVLRATLARVRRWAPRLAVSEWNLRPTSLDQTGHALAALIGGQIEAFRESREANIRTPYSREALATLLDQTGWSLKSESSIDAPDLQDAEWEIAALLRESLALDDLPPRLGDLVRSELDILRALSARTEPRPLSSYAILAGRV